MINSLDGYDLEDDRKTKVIAALEEEVFSFENEQEARQALTNFSCYNAEEFTFSDPWEIDGNAYTYHYLWCLYAIVWAIKQYDALKKDQDDLVREAWSLVAADDAERGNDGQ